MLSRREAQHGESWRPGAFFYSSAEDEELEIPPDQIGAPGLGRLLERLRGDGSRLLVRFENGIGIDFWIRADGTLEMSFGDPERSLWGCSTVSPGTGKIALEAAAAGESLRNALCGMEVEYFPEQAGPASPRT